MNVSGDEGAPPKEASLRASRELCFYCFDAILSALEERNCAPPDFADGKCAMCISWAKCNPKKGDEVEPKAKYSFEARGSLITMVPMRLHSEDFLRTIRDSAFEDPRQPAITAEDIQYLRCSVSLILEDTCKTIQNIDDWEIGKHGVRIEFQHNGKKRSKIYPPETILARGWTKQETIEEGISKAGYDGEITAELLRSVKVTRFATSTCIVSFKEYLKHVEEMEKKKKSASRRKVKTPPPSGEEDKEVTMIRRRKRYLRSWLKKVHPEKAAAPPSAEKHESNWNTWLLVLGVAVIVSAVFFLRFHEATYDADYESFQSNYDILEIDRGSPIALVKKAFKALSLKWHPDKNPGCKECADKFVRITDAYKQLMDYDRGTLRLVNQPGAAPPKKEEGKRDSGPKTTSTKKHKA